MFHTRVHQLLVINMVYRVLISLCIRIIHVAVYQINHIVIYVVVLDLLILLGI